MRYCNEAEYVAAIALGNFPYTCPYCDKQLRDQDATTTSIDNTVVHTECERAHEHPATLTTNPAYDHQKLYLNFLRNTSNTTGRKALAKAKAKLLR